MITTEEKNALKKEVEAIDVQVSEGKITDEKAQELKTNIAQERANNIETKVAIEEAKLAQLVQDKVDGKIANEVSKKRGGTKIVLGGSDREIGENTTEIDLGSMKIYNGNERIYCRHGLRCPRSSSPDQRPLLLLLRFYLLHVLRHVETRLYW